MENNRHSEIEHTFGCAFMQRGALCDCGACYVSPSTREMGAAVDALGLEWREPTRGIDYSRLAGGVAEGINDEEEES